MNDTQRTDAQSPETSAEPKTPESKGFESRASEAKASEPKVSKPYVDPSILVDEAAEMKDRLLRTLAEMENLRKRTEREVADARQYGVAVFCARYSGCRGQFPPRAGRDRARTCGPVRMRRRPR